MKCFLAALALLPSFGLAPCLDAQAEPPRLALSDLSESGRALAFEIDAQGQRITVRQLAAASWDELRFEVRCAEVGVPLLFVVPGGAGRVAPAVSTGQFVWRAPHVLPGRDAADLSFAVVPERSRFVVRLAGPGAASEAPYYPYSRFQQYIAEIAREPGAQLTQIGTSVQGRPLYRVVIDAPSNAEKKTVVMVARQHGGEDASSYLVEGALDLLLGRRGSTPDPELLRRVRWVVYPLMNPDGAVARARENANGFDLNRDWDRSGCNAGQQPETFAHQCDLETVRATWGIAIAGDHHGWGNSNHGGFRYAQGQSVSFVTVPEYQEARKDTTVIARHDPTQVGWQENGGTTGMLRAEMYHRFGFLIHTPEYNSSLSTSEEFYLKGQQWAEAMFDTLFAVAFTDAAGQPVARELLPGRVWVTVDDDDENLAPAVRENVVVVVTDRVTGDRETLILTETGRNTGVFRNAEVVRVVIGSANPGNGVLESAPQSTLTALYRDDDYPRDASTAELEVLRRDRDG